MFNINFLLKINNLSKKLFDFILPNRCLLCKNFSELIICQDCLNSIDFTQRQINFDSPYLDAIFSLTEYKDQIRAILEQIKFNGYNNLGFVLNSKIMKNIDLSSVKIDLAVAIPIHKARYKKRGYNQVEILFYEVLKKYHYLPLISRSKNTPPLFSLDKKERQKILDQAFSINSKFDIQHKNILVLDDICTSGTTLNEAAKLLKQYGANKIYGLTLSFVPEKSKIVL
ncbi:MAG: phosphoribosyltransferase family protein [Candidatus Margulisiibacteriota bacterium]|jgi:ComF family protein